VDTLAVELRRSIKAASEVLDQNREALVAEREAFETSRKLASNRGWLLLMRNGRYCCSCCSSHYHTMKTSTQRHSPWVKDNGGVICNSQLSRKICGHEVGEMHGLCVELDAERACAPLQYGFDVQLEMSRVITEKLFRTTLDNCLHYRSFLDYENLIELQHLNEAYTKYTKSHH
jgi:hypothetical protein